MSRPCAESPGRWRPLLLAPGQLIGSEPKSVLESHAFQNLDGPASGFPPRHPAEVARGEAHLAGVGDELSGVMALVPGDG